MSNEARDAGLKTLLRWLDSDRVAARNLWSVTVPNTRGMKVDCYQIRSHIVLIQRYRDGGWEIFIPACDSNEIALTLDAVEKHCGVNE